MDQTLDLGHFHYEPLPDPKNYIRLIKILRGSLHVPVTCHFTTWELEQAPKYHAISYTWGDPAETTLIIINGTPMTVRHNCEYALRQAYMFFHVWDHMPTIANFS
ncbi:hypothetical protein K504DRAFT_460302 [Pleomassaria siparia CBS 279.74]|uniref:Uncharacterized protein n=1 Tax=Pleomassaria siparia CBS 279.74 TaxID=1314801 RepID=A0A6G1JYN0_9PLEO|nr:hypothetical protein K504DRAFT_460302 [Pleomassaria siparia CBS 279.74]